MKSENNGTRIVRYQTESRFVTAIVGSPGRKLTPITWLDAPVRLHRIQNQEAERYCQPLDLPLKKSARTMLAAGKRLGITKGARQFLRDAVK